MRALRWPLLAAIGLTALGLFVACVGSDPTVDASPGDAGPEGSPPSTDGASGTETGAVQAPADGGADASGDAGSNYCATQVAAPGVSDFFCSDFDEPDAFGGWTTVQRDDGGTLQTTTDVLTSPPNALVANGLGGPTPIFGGSALTWKSTGAKTVSQIALRVDMNPTVPGGLVAPSTGSSELLKVSTPDLFASLNFTHGGSVGESSDFTGYFLAIETSGGAAAIEKIPLPETSQQLMPNVWTTVELIYIASGTLTLKYDTITVFSQSGLFTTSQTTARGTIGQVTSGVVNLPFAIRYDTAEIEVTRAS